MKQKPKFQGKSLWAANLEFNNTPEDCKPILCLIPENGLYVVIRWFSKAYCVTKGLTPIK